MILFYQYIYIYYYSYNYKYFNTLSEIKYYYSIIKLHKIGRFKLDSIVVINE